ncbi:MAG: DeoR family transcriptional regulator [Candidatus Marsarchaeota archaeon]
MPYRKQRETAAERMERLLEFIRENGKVSDEEVINFCREKLGVSEQTAFNYLNALERAGLIRVTPNGVMPWAT